MLIKNLNHLKELCKGKNQLECFVRLNGSMRSSKTLLIHPDNSITVHNDIDDTLEEFDSLDDVAKRHLTINEALQKRSFYIYDYEIKESLR